MAYSKKEMREFDRITWNLSSPDQMTRISARIDIKKFMGEHGKEKCDEMYAALTEREPGKKYPRLRMR